MNVPVWTIETADSLFDETNAVALPAEHNLVRMVGAEPSAAVRRRMADRQAAMEAAHGVTRGRTAVLIDSAMGRGVVTAWRWLTGTEVAAYAPEDVHRAAAFVAEEHAEALVALYHQCRSMIRAAA